MQTHCVAIKWPFSQTGKVRSGKNPKSWFFFSFSKHVLKLYFKLSRKKNPDFGFLTLPNLPVCVKNGHLMWNYKKLFPSYLQYMDRLAGDQYKTMIWCYGRTNLKHYVGRKKIMTKRSTSRSKKTLKCSLGLGFTADPPVIKTISTEISMCWCCLPRNNKILLIHIWKSLI